MQYFSLERCTDRKVGLEIQEYIQAIRFQKMPSVEAEAQITLDRFYAAVRLNPEEFLERRKVCSALRALERRVSRTGGKLEHLGTCRKKVFSEVRRIVSISG